MEDKKYNDFLKETYNFLDKTKLEDIEEEILEKEEEIQSLEKEKNDFIQNKINDLVDTRKKKKKLERNRRRKVSKKLSIVKLPK